jgi:hypothetical protein
MKNQTNPKLFALAILSGMFLFLSFTKSEVKENLTTAKSQSEQPAKVKITKAEQEYWIRWRNQFVWTVGGPASTLLPSKPGC